jgi:DnaK suppressor protein
MEKTADKFEDVTRKLMEMQQTLIRETKTGIGQMLNQGDNNKGASDYGDLADIEIMDSMKAVQFARQKTRIKAIEEALYKIEEGAYGICQDCEEEIPMGRLKAMPFALRCVECQESYEAGSLEYAEEIPHSAYASQSESGG